MIMYRAGENVWVMVGQPLDPPTEDDQRWPNPNLHNDYYAKSSDGGYHQWISAEQYLAPGMQGDIYGTNGLDEWDPVNETWTANPNERRKHRKNKPYSKYYYKKEHER